MRIRSSEGPGDGVHPNAKEIADLLAGSGSVNPPVDAGRGDSLGDELEKASLDSQRDTHATDSPHEPRIGTGVRQHLPKR